MGRRDRLTLFQQALQNNYSSRIQEIKINDTWITDTLNNLPHIQAHIRQTCRP